MLKIDELKKVDDRPYKDVSVPEWGGDVRLRVLSLGTMSDIGKTKNEDGSELTMGQHMALYVAHSIENEDGSRMFEVAQVGADLLLTKSPAVVQRLYKEAADLNGRSEAAEKQAAKKSKPTPRRASS